MYRVVLSRQATRYYQSLDHETAKRLVATFQTLEQEWHPVGAKRLRGELEGLWRVRIGGLRVIYEPRNEANELHVLKIGPRGGVY